MRKQSPDYSLHFPDLSIEWFRGIRKLPISQLGRVTLITGKNNTGKSSVLEALQLYTQNAAPEIIYNILTSREEYIRGMEKDSPISDIENEFHVSALFHGFPSLFEDFKPIDIATSGKFGSKHLRLQIGRVADKVSLEGQKKLFANKEGFFEENL